MTNRKSITNSPRLFFWVEEGQASLGNIDTAKKYIHTAAEIGADGIEFQLAVPEEFYIATHPSIEHYRKIQYSNNQIKDLINCAKKSNIKFIAAVLSESLIPVLVECGCDAFVINASDINNPAIVDSVIESGLPFFISLPLASEEEIEWIISRCRLKEAKNFALMLGQHTMASGENGVMPEDSNLGYLLTLKKKYGLPVGYIDHSTSIAMPAISRAAGAVYISKHLSLNTKVKGPDWFVCLESKDMRASIDLAHKIDKSLSKKDKVLAPGEYLDKSVMRRSIVSAGIIPKGTIIKKSMLAFKRPGNGTPPLMYEGFVGKKAKRDIEKDELLTNEFFE